MSIFGFTENYLRKTVEQPHACTVIAAGDKTFSAPGDGKLNLYEMDEEINESGYYDAAGTSDEGVKVLKAGYYRVFGQIAFTSAASGVTGLAAAIKYKLAGSSTERSLITNWRDGNDERTLTAGVGIVGLTANSEIYLVAKASGSGSVTAYGRDASTFLGIELIKEVL